MKRLLTTLSIVVMVVLLARESAAMTQRLALLVSNNQGGEDLPALRYTTRDAQRLSAVLNQFGGFETRNITQLHDLDAAEVWRSLAQIDAQIQQIQNRGDDVVFVFYYSGHAKDGWLLLGDSRLDMAQLKTRLQKSPARVRIALIDSCGAGAMTRSKGGQLAPPFVVAVDDSLTAAGQVVIASSSADEASQESDAIQGSFFTHYFAAALRGDADNNHDGQVTLNEAYAYAYSHTVTATATTRAGTQHPSYQYDLRGAGDVILTAFAEKGALLTFPQELVGRYFLVDDTAQRIVAEIDKNSGETRQIAVKGGHYVIKKRLPDHLLMQRVEIAPKSALVVDEQQMQRVAFRDDYAKGSPILRATVQDAALSLSLSMGAGLQAVFAQPGTAPNDLFPNIALVSIEARVHNLLRKNLLLSADLAFGSSEQTLEIDTGASLGTLRYPLRYNQVQGGLGLFYEWRPGKFHVVTGPRFATLVMQRAFAPGAPIDNQFLLTFSPGWSLILGWQFWSHAHLELLGRVHYLPYFVEQDRSFGYVETLLSLWWDF